MSHLISAAELAHEIEDVVVLDVRWALTAGRAATQGPVGRPGYDAGHVPGAFFVDLDSELAAQPGEGGRHPLPDAATLERLVRRSGIEPGTRVVVYDGRDSMAAARAWWVLRWAGVQDVRVLDGGFAAWTAAGLPVSTQEPGDRHGEGTVHLGSLPTLDADGAARLAREGLLVDARATERYAGEVEPIDPVAGHVPGAVTSPTAALVGPDGRFREDLADHWARVVAAEAPAGGTDSGADATHEGRAVGVYCGSGVTAAHHVLALAEIGVDATLYPGSWSEWIRDASRPVATCRAPG
ncbi:sulfurtransferase [Intrasporangium sp. YIM S08009]|uniref:sulfurtransferase n=1 Tax=Intrasporangium zincisolvens TaxID=3080018 RepID=UPI002B051D9E|nr:sulfurtransferase [Intrasporangium sp. YIM S08009]